eukprot:3476891-Alexandrium_andersonii.AAC.1
MSASLVGSEMCIRDRCCAVGPLSLLVRAARGRALPVGVARHGRRSHVPVSYTHLTLPTICSV